MEGPSSLQEPEWSLNPHAYHRNLPPHHIDKDGIPYVTRFAQRKSRQVLKLAHSIQLTESLFVQSNDKMGEELETDVDDDDDGTFDQDTMVSLMKKCTRLHSQLNTITNLKHSGVTQIELCKVILHLLRLVTATVTIETEPQGETDAMETESPSSSVTLHFENVGYLFNEDGKGKEEFDVSAQDADQLELELSRDFALPTPARESVLSVLITLLTKKAPLLSVSNAALYPEGSDGADRVLLILHWKALLRMLLRTAPYLDEHKVGTPPTASNSRQNTILRRTVHLIRNARKFFDQGIRPPAFATTVRANDTARSVWEMVRSDLLFHTHTHSCYRALIMLYLFQPSRCTSDFYLEVMPDWLESWSSIDRCPEFDFLWLVMFCRARKHITPTQYDWGRLRRRLLTQCQYWLQIPVGGAGDKSFPRAASPRTRSCPSRLKAFVGIGSSYEEGIDFIAKVAKLLVTSLGTYDLSTCSEAGSATNSANSSEAPAISSGTEDMLRFLSFAAPYFNPSNVGSWTFTLGAFLHYFSYELCHRIGRAASLDALKSSHPFVAFELCIVEPSQSFATVPPHEIVALLDALLPLCQQALYSKNGNVSRAGEAAMVYLTQIDPVHVAPPFLDFATRALDYSAVNLAHQAPAALSAMTRVVQPALRRDPSILLSRLPEILRLSLAGIDSNDQNKTIRTLIFYRNVASWIPIGGRPKDWTSAVGDVTESNDDVRDGTVRLGKNLVQYMSKAAESAKYAEAIRRLPETSFLYQQDSVDSSGSQQTELLAEEAALALSDWSLAFLERVYALLRAGGEREKAGKTASGVASRHSSVDVQQARNFSRVMKECLLQVFAAMDDETHKSAVRSVAQFVAEETLPLAAKDASALCQAVAGARCVKDGQVTSISSEGLDALVPILTEDLQHHSNKTVIYRLRCLAGAVRNAGQSVFKHRNVISHAIQFALSSEDKHVLKTGCKLFRHVLASQCESYPIMSDLKPRSESSSTFGLGKSAHLRSDPIQWHVPSGEQIDFACSLLATHVLRRIDDLCSSGKPSCSDDELSVEMVDVEESENGGCESDARSGNVDMQQWRRTLRIIRYAMRGCSGIALDTESDANADEGGDNATTPHEKAVLELLRSASEETKSSLMCLRGRVCALTASVLSVVASETADSDAKEHTLVSGSSHETKSTENSSDEQPEVKRTGQSGEKGSSQLVGTDTKVCKEVSDIALLLLTRRGASFRCQEAKTVWKAQKQLITDYVLASQADCIAAALQRSALYEANLDILYKDGEDGGKTIPRRLLVSRLQLFYESLQRNASFEIPRRLRRLAKLNPSQGEQLFTVETNMVQELTKLSSHSATKSPHSIDGYEGLVDGLFALSCHTNTEVRSSGFGVIDYILTRFGWIVQPRVPYLLTALQLADEDEKGKFGIPSCAKLSTQVDAQGKHKRLAEVVKGVCSLLSAPRAVKAMLEDENIRFTLARTLCRTEKLISLLPPEEMQKLVYYMHGIFSPFRSKLFSLPRLTENEQSQHEACLTFLMDILLDDETKGANGLSMASDSSLTTDGNGTSDADADGNVSASSAHWRNRLLVGWFLLSFVDGNDLLLDRFDISSRLWSTCFQLLENEMGQPIQRVAVGLFGRLVSFALPSEARLNISLQDSRCSRSTIFKKETVDVSALCEKLQDESFCHVLGKAVVFDHKEDTRVGGGHQAQWSAGVEEILRDASSNVASRTLFPFQRISRSSATFKVQHAQLIESLLLLVGKETAHISTVHLLEFAKEMASAPPSEDQRNQQCTSAEIFGGVCRAMLQLADNPENRHELWDSLLIPFLENVIPKIPISLVGAFFDAFRYGIHFFPPSFFFELTSWVVGNVGSSLWQPALVSASESNDKSEVAAESLEDTEAAAGNGSQGTDGFTAQTKWLYLANAILVELDEETDVGCLCRLPWYSATLLDGDSCSGGVNASYAVPADDSRKSWNLITDQLLPLLLNALGHPYDSCRDHISNCLFRICYCHRKMVKASMAPNRSKVLSGTEGLATGDGEPGAIIVKRLASIDAANELSFKEHYNALITARKFIAYCLHMGDVKHEYSDFIIPLLPLAFESLKVTVEDISDSAEEDIKVDAAKRSQEAEVVKGFRYVIADVSSSCVIYYGKDEDITKVLAVVGNASKHEYWQVRHAATHFLRCFQGYHKYLFHSEHNVTTTKIVAALLADDRREVSSAAMAALTGILAATPLPTVAKLVKKYAGIANRSKIKKKKKSAAVDKETPETEAEVKEKEEKERKRARNQQISVFFLCAAVLARPYDTPPYVPEALAALSKHSFERSAPLGVRDAVKKCCAEFKRTHMSDNWEVHRRQFTQEQLEALEDVVSSPHYYA